MPPFKRHVFVCTNVRSPGHPKGCCSSKGSEAVREALKLALKRRGLDAEVRANAAGCLDACEYGVTVVVYPDNVWYGRVTLDDVPELVEEHLVHGRPVARLRITF
ncbi:MAG: (2Fe-2S) ferredoxin domain-containing protein [Myxococcales bacterium]